MRSFARAPGRRWRWWDHPRLEDEQRAAVATCRGRHRADGDQALMARTIRGDLSAFSELVEKYKHPIIGFASRALGDPFEAQDVAQNVFLQAFRQSRRFRFESRFSTWLYTIARNLTIDHLRRKRPAVSLDALMEVEDSALPYEPASAGPSALDTVAQHEVAERVTAALSGLPIEYRETVVLRFQEGLGLEEIATLTKIPLGTVKSRLYRALNILMGRIKGVRP